MIRGRTSEHTGTPVMRRTIRRWRRKGTFLCGLFLSILFGSLSCNAQEATPPPSRAEKKTQTFYERFLFLQSKYPRGNWSPKGLEFQDVFFPSQDGTNLHGWYCPAKDPRAVILISHGNAGHVADRAPWLRYLQHEAQVSVFIFDYQGYGRSEGIPTVKGAIADAKAARKKLREIADIKDSEMFLMGESLGGAIAVQLAADSPPRGLILQSTFSSLREIADLHYSKLSWMVPKHTLNSHAKISDYQGPLLVSHGTADQIIPLSSGKKLYHAANEPKHFVEVKRAGHRNWFTREYANTLNQFIQLANKHAMKSQEPQNRVP